MTHRLSLLVKIQLPKFAALLIGVRTVALSAVPIPDAPFWQDVAVRIPHAPGLTNASFKKLCVDKENVVYVRTDKGVARVFDDKLALDKSYRPLAGKLAQDIALTPEGNLAYRFADGWVSNGDNGRRN